MPAIVLAVTPDPGLAYVVAAQVVEAGRRTGVCRLRGLVHVWLTTRRSGESAPQHQLASACTSRPTVFRAIPSCVELG